MPCPFQGLAVSARRLNHGTRDTKPVHVFIAYRKLLKLLGAICGRAESPLPSKARPNFSPQPANDSPSSGARSSARAWKTLAQS